MSKATATTENRTVTPNEAKTAVQHAMKLKRQIGRAHV